MKKILLTTVIAVAAFFTAANAGAQSFHVNVIVANQRQAFYYYPNANVYFNLSSNQYIYDRNGVWITARNLPFSLGFNQARFTVYHNGGDVWEDNRFHVNDYNQYRLGHQQVTYQDNDRNIYRDNDRNTNNYNDHDNSRNSYNNGNSNGNNNRNYSGNDGDRR